MKIKSSELSKIIAEEVGRALRESEGNTVYALLNVIEYEGEELLGVFSSREPGVLAARKTVANRKAGDWIVLLPCQLDGSVGDVHDEANTIWDEGVGWTDAVMGETLGLDHSNRGQQEPLTRAAGAPVVEVETYDLAYLIEPEIRELVEDYGLGTVRAALENVSKSLKEGGKGELKNRSPWGEKTKDKYDAPRTRKGRSDAKRRASKGARRSGKADAKAQADG